MTTEKPKAAEELPPKKEKKQGPRPEYTPNVVPLIDVLFMLLLFFLLSTHFRQNEGDILGSLPGTDAAPATGPQTNIDIVVNYRGNTERSYSVGATNVPFGSDELASAEQLYRNLMSRQQALGARADEVPVFIKADPGAPWKYVVEAFNQALRAKFKKITISA